MKHYSRQRTQFILLFLFLFLSNTYPYTKRDLLQKLSDKKQIENLLIKNRQWVSYPAYRNRAAWSDFLGEYAAGYIKKGERALRYKWQVITASNYLEYERSGSRKIMETPYGRNNQMIIDLLLAELAEGKGRFIDKLIDGVFFSCEMTSWTLSAHLPRQKSKRSLPEKGENIIALVTGDMGSIFSWIHYFFHDEFDKINPEISRRLRHELEQRILTPFLNNNFWWMGFGYKEGMIINNWNPWCNFNVLQCFMLMENDTARLAKAMYRTMQSVDQFINYSKSDGACEEGPSYWGHAAGKLYDYLQLLYDGTDGKISLFDEPMIKSMGEYIARSYVGNGWVVNFADASAKLNPQPDLIYRYGKAVGSKEMMGFASYLFNEKTKKTTPNFGRDIFRTFETLRYRKELKERKIAYHPSIYTWYPETEFCYMRTDDGLLFAAKGGYNNESHNHNDAGTFLLYADNTPMLIDVGVGTYTRQTFSSERYTIWTMQSLYHNLPEINGKAQQYGQKFKASDVKFNRKRRTFSLDIAGAYPENSSIKSWKRTYHLSDRTLKIADNFSIRQPTVKNKLHFMTWGNVEIQKNTIKISVQDKTVHLHFDKKQFAPSLEKIELKDPRLTRVWGNKLYRITLDAKSLKTKGHYQLSITKK